MAWRGVARPKVRSISNVLRHLQNVFHRGWTKNKQILKKEIVAAREMSLTIGTQRLRRENEASFLISHSSKAL